VVLRTQRPRRPQRAQRRRTGWRVFDASASTGSSCAAARVTVRAQAERRCRRTPARGKSDASLSRGRPGDRGSGPAGRRAARARAGPAGSGGLRRAGWRVAPRGHTPASSSDRRDHTGHTERTPGGSRRGRRRRIGTSPRAPAGPTRGWTSTARYGKTGAPDHAPPRDLARGPGGVKTPGPHPPAPSAGPLYLRSSSIATSGSQSLVQRPKFRTSW
jgi:hypothetical protein